VELPKNTLVGSAEINAVAKLLGGVRLLLVSPPQLDRTIVVKMITRFTLYFFIYYSHSIVDMRKTPVFIKVSDVCFTSV